MTTKPRPPEPDELLEQLQTATDVMTAAGEHAAHERRVDGETVYCSCGACVNGRLFQ